MAGQGTVTIKVLGDVANVKRAFGEVSHGIGDIESKAQGMGQRMQSIGGKLTAGVTLPIVGMFAAAGAAAADENQKMEVLANLLRNTTGATQDQIDANEEWITSMQNATGVADDELRVAMGKLLVAGRSVEQSHKDLAVAADIAAARHIPLETVVNAMAKAAQGSTGALQKMGVATKGAAGEALTYDQILQSASKTMGGSAAAAADTAAGRMAILKLKLEDLVEQIGSALLPIVSRLADWLSKIAVWFTNLSPRVQTLIIVVAGLAAAVGPVVTLIGSLGAAFGILVSPVALVILAIAAVAAGAIYAYTHFKTFRDVVDTVAKKVVEFAGFMKDLLDPVFKFISDHSDELKVALGALALVIGALLLVSLGSLVIAIGTVTIAITLLVAAVAGVVAAIEWLWARTEGIRNFLGGVFADALDLATTAVDQLTTAFGAARDVVQEVWDKTEPLRDFFANRFREGIDIGRAAIDALRGAFDILWSAIQRVVDKVQWLIDKIPTIPSIPGVDLVTGGGVSNAPIFRNPPAPPTGGDPSIDPRKPGGQSRIGQASLEQHFHITALEPVAAAHEIAQHQRAAQFLGN